MQENLRLLNRISSKRSDYAKKSLDKQWKQVVKY